MLPSTQAEDRKGGDEKDLIVRGIIQNLFVFCQVKKQYLFVFFVKKTPEL